MKCLYIAGPYSANTPWEVEQNVRRAEAVSLQVAYMGAAPLCPHALGRFTGGTCTEEFWLAATLELLRRCDAVALVRGWEQSSGTRGEVEEARRLGRPIFDCSRASGLLDLENWIHAEPEVTP